MKNVFKKNQMIITALAIMIAVAGYLNYSGTRLDSVKKAAGTDTAESGTDAEAAADLSAEDLYAQSGLEELQFEDGDIASLDGDGTEGETAEVEENEEPGEAVMASTSPGTGFAAAAKLSREQLRSRNKETLLDIINNANISDAQKQSAIDSMVELTDLAEKEAAAELLLEAKGFEDVVVSLTDGKADVVVNMADVDDAGRAQIEDIVKRKTGVTAENIVITPAAEAE